MGRRGEWSKLRTEETGRWIGEQEGGQREEQVKRKEERRMQGFEIKALRRTCVLVAGPASFFKSIKLNFALNNTFE